MNIFCLTVDGLHHGMIGAYGNGWVETPTLDALAADSVLFDRYYTDSMELDSIFGSLWGPPDDPLPARWAKQNYRTILLTDDDDVFHHENAADFDEVHRLDFPSPALPAKSLEKTQFFKALATAAALLENRTEEQTDSPFFLWVHLRGFRGPWDFPMQYRQRFQEEEDPDPYPGTTPPELDCRTGEGNEEEPDPDDLQSVLEAYGGGISVLDDSLAGLVEFLEEKNSGKNTLFLLGSTRGFSLGEHGRIGPNDDLFGENLQLPLFIRFFDGTGRSVRSSALVQSWDVAEFLASPLDPENPLSKLIFEETEHCRDEIRIRSSNGGSILITPEWFVRKTPSGSSQADPGESKISYKFELFSKPDDRWEVNDVADRCQHVLETFGDFLHED